MITAIIIKIPAGLQYNGKISFGLFETVILLMQSLTGFLCRR